VLGDGAERSEHGPFDRICLTAAPAEMPMELARQLKMGGRMVAPIGTHEQKLVVWDRTIEGFDKRDSIAVRFVPMTHNTTQTKEEKG